MTLLRFIKKSTGKPTYINPDNICSIDDGIESGTTVIDTIQYSVTVAHPIADVLELLGYRDPEAETP